MMKVSLDSYKNLDLTVNKDIQDYIEEKQCKIYTLEQFLNRAFDLLQKPRIIICKFHTVFSEFNFINRGRSESSTAHHIIINDILNDHYFRELFVKMKEKIIGHLKYKNEELNLNVRNS